MMGKKGNKLLDTNTLEEDEFYQIQTFDRPRSNRKGNSVGKRKNSPREPPRTQSLTKLGNRKRSRTNLVQTAREFDPLLLKRLKPQFTGTHVMEKEALYETNIAVRMEMNNVKDENMKLRTQLNRLMKELERRDDQLNNRQSVTARNAYNTHLVGNLKIAVQDWKTQCRTVQEENNTLKRHIKSTRLFEMEVEMKTYVDECLRLRRQVESLLLAHQQSNIQEAPVETKQDERQNEIMESLQAEVAMLRTKLEAAMEQNAKLREIIDKKANEKPVVKPLRGKAPKRNRITNRNSQTITDKDQITQLKNEVQDLKLKLRASEQNSGFNEQLAIVEKVVDRAYIPKDEDITALIDAIKDYISNHGLSTDEFFLQLDIHKTGRVWKQDLIDEWSKRKLVNQDEVITYLLTHLDIEDFSDIPISLILEFFAQRTSTSHDDLQQSPIVNEVESLKKVGQEDVEKLLKHISLRMQLHRFSKAKLATTLFGKDFDKDSMVNVEEISNSLKEEPFNIENEADRVLIARFWLEPRNKNFFTTQMEIDALEAMKKEVAGKLFMEMEDWDAFKPEDEAEFDKVIGICISKNKLSFKEAWKSADDNKKGFITLEEFMEVLETLEIEFTHDQLRYMVLLFYSHSMELNKVPYKQFIEAYGVIPPSQLASAGTSIDISMKSEDREALIRKWLQVISSALLATNKSAVEVFVVKNGVLYPEEFMQGLAAINVPEMDKKTLLLFMEAMQYEEDDDELWIDFDYFMNLLGQIKDSEYPSTPASEAKIEKMHISGEQVQRSVSILESPNINHSVKGDETAIQEAFTKSGSLSKEMVSEISYDNEDFEEEN